MQVSLNVASHEVRRCYQIGRADRCVTETQVRAGETSRLLRVVREVSLAVLVGVVTNNLHGVLVSTYGTIGTQTIELSLEHTLATECNLLNLRQRGEGHVVYDTNGEVVLGLGHSEVVEHADDLSGSGIVRTETVTATYDDRTILHIVEGILDVEVQRLAVGSGLLGAVQNGNLLDGLGNSSQQVLHRERTIEVYADHTYLLAVGVQVVDSLAGSVGSRTHEDNHAVGILGSVVREQVILTTGNLGELAQILLNNLGNCIVVGVAGLTVCEEGLGVLSSTASDRTLGAHSTVAETLDVLFLHQRTNILLVEQLNLVILVRGAETVEEVNERHAGLERCEVSSSGHIHNLLY